MNYGKIFKGFLFVLLFAIGARLIALEPIPWYDGIAFDKKNELKQISQRLFSVNARLTFTKSGKAELGFFECELKPDGTLFVTLIPGKVEIMRERPVMRSKKKLKLGETFDLAVNFSAERRRFSMYLNGKWQNENAIFFVPETLSWTLPDFTKFPGKVERFLVYDAALESEDLTPTEKAGKDFDGLQERLRVVPSANRNLMVWADELKKRVEKLREQAKSGMASIGAFKRLENDISNLEKLASELAPDRAIAVYEVSPTSQVLHTSYELPEDGKIVSELRVFAAKTEYHPLSVIVVPFSPVKSFTLQLSELKSENGQIYSPDNVEIKLVKRWYRAGGWMNYFRDQHQRLLVPDLLLNDDRLVKVDELRQINYLRLNYPSGTVYADVSRCEFEQRDFNNTPPAFDAEKLMPLELPEAGRNQQYVLRFHIPEKTVSGFYKGKLNCVADGKIIGSVDVVLRVLPFVLPQAKTYYDINRTYFSHINTMPNGSPEYFRRIMKKLIKYNYFHASGIISSPWRVEIAKELNYPLQEIVGAHDMPTADLWYRAWGSKKDPETESDREQLDKIYLREMKRILEEVNLPEDTVFYPVFTSENDIYRIIKERSEHPADLLHKNSNIKRFSHSMTDRYIVGAIDSTDMDSTSHVRKDWADIWHAAGARVINYAEPFPGPENPAWFRRKMGLEMYKSNYDGHMMHGLITRHWNEFSDWPEDPAYKNFGMMYPLKDDAVERLALVGAGEAFCDVRYATELRILALPRLESSNVDIRKAAKRSLAWLEKIDKKTYDMDAYRAGCALRIVHLLDLIRTNEGK